MDRIGRWNFRNPFRGKLKHKFLWCVRKLQYSNLNVMKEFKYNRIALIYFCASWLIGALIILLTVLKTDDDTVIILIFLSGINLVINVFSVLLLFALIFIFPENRTEFRNSMILLLFNFPVLFFLFLILSLT